MNQEQINNDGLEDNQPQQAEVTEQQELESTPLYKKWWFWTIIGVVAVGAGAGIGVAVILSDRETLYEFGNINYENQ